MTHERTATIDLPFEQSVGVFADLERARQGTNGYGGNVAEIYAYRLVPPGFDQSNTDELAKTAARNLTAIARQFVDICDGVEVGIEIGPRKFHVIDPRTEEFPPFDHRIHVSVSNAAKLRTQFAHDLLALWENAHEVESLPTDHFIKWLGVSKDLLLSLGMQLDPTSDRYAFPKPHKKPRARPG